MSQEATETLEAGDQVLAPGYAAMFRDGLLFHRNEQTYLPVFFSLS